MKNPHFPFRRRSEGLSSRSTKYRERRLEVEVLESRILYSATPVEAPESDAPDEPVQEASATTENSSAVSAAEPETDSTAEVQSSNSEPQVNVVPTTEAPPVTEVSASSSSDAGSNVSPPQNSSGGGPLADLVINEVLAEVYDFGIAQGFNTNGDGAIHFAHDEFIELLNTGSAPLNVGGLQLWSQSGNNLYTVPPGTTISTNGTLLIVHNAVGDGSGSLPNVPVGSVALDAGVTGTAQFFHDTRDSIRIYDPITNCYIQASYNGGGTGSFSGFPSGATQHGTTTNLGNTAPNGSSYTLSPDGDTSSPGVLHSTLGNGSVRASPGVLASAPVVFIPNFVDPLSVNELIASSANSYQFFQVSGITVTDLDSPGNLTVTVTITGGDLSVDPLASGGVSAGNITGQNTSTLTLTGTAAQINNTFQFYAGNDNSGLKVSPANNDPDFNDNIVGSVSTILITATDADGNSGSNSILFSFTPTNDPPTITSLPAQSITEDTDLVFSAANGNAIVVADPDSDELAAPNNTVRVSLSVNSGLLTLSTVTGLNFSLDGNIGDGTQDGSMIFRGTLSAVNTALAGLIYRGNSNFNSSGANAADTFSIVVNDLGNAGQDPGVIGEMDTGDATSEEASTDITINVTAVNDEPVNTTPGLQTILENTTVTFNAGNGNAIQVSDIDVDETASPNNLLQVTLAADSGATLTLTSATGLDFGFSDTFGTGDSAGGDGTLVFRGTVSDLNNALNSLTLTPAGGFTGNIDLVVTTSDLGNTGLDTTTAPTTNFNIEINYPDSSITASQQAIIEQAIQKWEEVIIDNGLDLAVDLTITATSAFIDGENGTLATGGFTSTHAGTNFSSAGTLNFDSADIGNQEVSGELYVLALHELGHAIGLGTRWGAAGVLSGSSGNFSYTGAKAVSAFNFLFGTSVSSFAVEDDPGAADAHWEENEGTNPLTTEVMTGTQNSASDELSILSVGSLEDIGYEVNYLGADTYNGISGEAFLTFLGGGQKSDSDTIIVNVGDGVAPVLDSFTRQTPSGENTAADTLVFRATFSEDVLNVDAGDFLISGTTTATITNFSAVNASTYDLTISGGDLATFNGVVGLNLFAAQDITDSSSTPMTTAEPLIDQTFTVDNISPTPSLSTASNPVNSTTFVVTIDFSETVSGFLAGDLSVIGGSVQGSLTDNGNGNFSATILATGEGTVTIDLAANAAQDLAGNLSSAATQLGVLVDTTVPTADITDVSPDPRNTNAGSVGITFSEAVSGVSITDFALTRNGSSVSLSGLSVGGSGSNYSINLSSVTQAEGAYVLTLFAAASGITDQAGNTLAGNATDSWSTDTTAPTADIDDVSPDPRNTHAGTVGINFSEAVSGVDITDFALTRNGGAVNISALSVSGAGSNYSIDLSSVTALDGDYVLTLTAAISGIQDAVGNGLVSNATDAWQADFAAPTADLSDVDPDPQNLNAGTVNIVFSEAVSGVDIGDFSLTFETNPIDISGLTITGSGANYALDLSSVTGSMGDFVLTLTAAGSNIQDLAGNALVANAAVTIPVTFANDPPVLGNITDKSVQEGTALSFIATATDPNTPADTLAFSLDAASLAKGMSINSATGEFSWTPQNLHVGDHTVTITVADNGAGTLSDSQAFLITVNLVPLTETTEVLIDGSGNLVIVDINGGDTSDDLVIEIIDSQLSVRDFAGNDIGTRIASANRISAGELRFDLTLFSGDIIVRTLGGDDAVSVGDMSGLPGGIIIEDGTGQDSIEHSGIVELTGSGAFDYNAEKITLLIGATLTTDSGGITLTANAADTGTGRFTGIDSRTATITSATGDITLSGRGGDTGGNNDGIYLLDTDIAITGGGNLDITGFGGGTTSSSEGIALWTGTNLSVAGNGALTLTGTGGSGTGSTNRGVYIHKGATATVVDGELAITGTGGSNGKSNNRGVQIFSSTLTSMGDGDITLVGNGTGIISKNIGIDLNQALLTATGTGDINLSGNGTAGAGVIGSSNQGINLLRAELSSTDGDIALTGIGGSGKNSNDGLRDNRSIFSSLNGEVTITGAAQSDSSVSNNRGLFLRSTVLAAAGNIALSGTGGTGISNNEGLQHNGGSITSSAGSIALTGSADLSTVGSKNSGLQLRSLTISAATGITATGIAGGGTNINIGTVLNRADFTSATGAVQVSGTAQSTTTGVNNRGIDALNSNFTGDSIDMDAIGGGGSSNDEGLRLNRGTLTASTGAITLDADTVTATSGSRNTGAYLSLVVANAATDIIVTATAGAGTSFNIGTYLNRSELTAASGNVQITGAAQATTTGSTNRGIEARNTTFSGIAITLTATGGAGTSNNESLRLTGGSLTATSGAITLNAATVAATSGSRNTGAYLNSVVAGAATDIFVTSTAGGGASSNVGTFLNNSELTASAGMVQITGTAQTTTTGNNNRGIDARNTTLSGTAIALDAIGGGGGSNNEGLRLTAGSITATSGAITIDAEAQGSTTSNNNSGAYLKTGAINASNGIVITATGGSGKSNNFGAYISAPTVAAGSGNIQITGTAHAGTLGSNNQGIQLNKASLSGIDITLTGNGGGGANNNQGVRIFRSSVLADDTVGSLQIIGIANGTTTGRNNSGVHIFNAVTLGDSLIDIDGTGGGGSGNNHGIYMHLNITAPAAVTDGTAGLGEGSEDEFGDFFSP